MTDFEIKSFGKKNSTGRRVKVGEFEDIRTRDSLLRKRKKNKLVVISFHLQHNDAPFLKCNLFTGRPTPPVQHKSDGPLRKIKDRETLQNEMMRI